MSERMILDLPLLMGIEETGREELRGLALTAPKSALAWEHLIRVVVPIISFIFSPLPHR